MKTTRRILLFACLALAALANQARAADKIRLLIIDGQNNHNWKATTPPLTEMLTKSGLFTVDVLTSPPKGSAKAAWAKFKPDFAKYGVVLSNYNGQSWPAEVNRSFERYMAGGGGLVVYHAGAAAFPGWAEWNKMIALGWRNNKFGDRVCLDDAGKEIRMPKGTGAGAGHGPQYAYEIVDRRPEHPIMKGMPAKWTHPKD